MVLRQFHCESLAREFATEGLMPIQKAGLAYRWDDMLKESQVLQLLLDLLERLETKGVAAELTRHETSPMSPSGHPPV